MLLELSTQGGLGASRGVDVFRIDSGSTITVMSKTRLRNTGCIMREMNKERQEARSFVLACVTKSSLSTGGPMARIGSRHGLRTWFPSGVQPRDRKQKNKGWHREAPKADTARHPKADAARHPKADTAKPPTQVRPGALIGHQCRPGEATKEYINM
jgi:hypothetical protein